MTRFELRPYNGQWDHRGVIQRIRRKIAARVRMGECVLIDGEGVIGLATEKLESICSGLPADKMRVIRPSQDPFHTSPVRPEL